MGPEPLITKWIEMNKTYYEIKLSLLIWYMKIKQIEHITRTKTKK